MHYAVAAECCHTEKPDRFADVQCESWNRESERGLTTRSTIAIQLETAVRGDHTAARTTKTFDGNANKLHFVLIDFPRDFRSERLCVRLFLIIQNRNKNIFAFFPVHLACADEQG